MDEQQKDIADGCFSIRMDEPERLMGDRLSDYLGVFPSQTGEYYLPPISLIGLAQMSMANAHHGACLAIRRNMATISYRAGGLSIRDFRASCVDLLTFGHSYLQVVHNRLGGVTSLRQLPALNMRRKTPTAGGGYRLLLANGEFCDYVDDDIIEVAEYDTVQQIYGMPDWLGGFQSALLNEDATLFRRRYYVNGAHLGYILYTRDAKMKKQTQDALESAFRSGKGVGNFKASYIHIPNGEEKAVQIIPIGDISHKDDFNSIKSVSASDVQIAHRVPPALLGVIPNGVASFGDQEKTEKIYRRNETQALCQNFLDINNRLPTNLRLKFCFTVEE